MIDLLIITIGNTFSAFSWIPQIIKIVKTRDVSGFDIRAYLCSIIASAIFLSYAIFTHTWMLMFFAGINFTLGSTETLLIYWYGVSNKMKGKNPSIMEISDEILHRTRHSNHSNKKNHKINMFNFTKIGNAITRLKKRGPL